jgi:hypothetical protein
MIHGQRRSAQAWATAGAPPSGRTCGYAIQRYPLTDQTVVKYFKMKDYCSRGHGAPYEPNSAGYPAKVRRIETGLDHAHIEGK